MRAEAIYSCAVLLLPVSTRMTTTDVRFTDQGIRRRNRCAAQKGPPTSVLEILSVLTESI